MPSRSAAQWGAVLGFALGGFFDGILLHQILQWHHLLSLVEGAGDARMQILWDGYFHALMYLIAAIGFTGVWRHRAGFADAPGRFIGAALLTGFGLWHIVDSILSHWLLGIHRIKLDSANPLLWDVAWFIIFGLLPLAIGIWILRASRGLAAAGKSGTMAASVAGLIAAGMAYWSLREAPEQVVTTIVFAPWVTPADAIDALRATESSLVRSDAHITIVFAAVPKGRRLDLYRHGALLVGNSDLPIGCFNWITA